MSHLHRASRHQAGSVTHYVVAYENVDAWIQAAAADFVRVGVASFLRRGAFHVVLPGGSTPRKVLGKLSPEFVPPDLLASGIAPSEPAPSDPVQSELAQPGIAPSGPEPSGTRERGEERASLFESWLRATHVYFGDERGVPPTDADSNYRMVEEAWLSHSPIPADQVHRIEGELDLVEAADRYNEVVARLLGPSAVESDPRTVPESDSSPADLPRAFDLVALGIGPDGHTASLIPGTPLDYIAEPWVGVGPAPMSPAQVRRVTLTPAALATTRATRFWVSGDGKAEVVHAAVTGTGMQTIIPEVVRRGGEAVWVIDGAAGARLDGNLDDEKLDGLLDT